MFKILILFYNCSSTTFHWTASPFWFIIFWTCLRRSRINNKLMWFWRCRFCEMLQEMSHTKIHTLISFLIIIQSIPFEVPVLSIHYYSHYTKTHYQMLMIFLQFFLVSLQDVRSVRSIVLFQCETLNRFHLLLMNLQR